MLEHALPAFLALIDPIRIGALLAGMAVGMIFGMLPGLGGVAAVSILLPFIYLLDDYSGLAMLLGAVAVVYTADTITSVLLGAPGSPASAPTAIEGHALAKQGKAAEALGVGFLASMVGGLLGAVILLFAIPVAGPIVLSLGTPELFMFAVVGLFFASSMLGKNLAKGLGAALFGIFIGSIGPASAEADFRFTLDQVYLLDGLSLTIVALGLFGVAEVIAMLASGGGISGGAVPVTNWRDGFVGFVRHRWLILRSAFIGVFGGFVPAVGASASTWVAYGHAIRSSKEPKKFGKGDIRGVAAAEGANNATIISDLIPTLLFSVPGGPAAAIFLGAMFSFGYYPGPRMITQNPDIMFLIVWSVALASVIGALVCFAVTPVLARLTKLPFALIAAPLVLVMVMGAYQSTGTMGDMVMLLLLGLVGWAMKHADWPRAPALVGFVLADPMEQYFWLSNQIHGWSWLARPGVIIIILLLVTPLLYRWWKARNVLADSSSTDDSADANTGDVRVNFSLSLVLLAVFVWAFVSSLEFSPDSRLLPWLALLPGIPTFALLVYQSSKKLGLSEKTAALSEIPYLLALGVYVLGIYLFGFHLATVPFVAWMLFGCAGSRPITGLAYGVVIYGLSMFLFGLLRGGPPGGIFF